MLQAAEMLTAARQKGEVRSVLLLVGSPTCAALALPGVLLQLG